MANGQVVTDSGKIIILNRTFIAAPTVTSPTQFKVGTGTTTPSLADTDLETPITIGGSAFKDFITGYPIINNSTFESTIRCLVNSLEANGNTLTEFGIVNEDGTPLMFSRAVHTGIIKSSSNEVAYVEKDTVI